MDALILDPASTARDETRAPVKTKHIADTRLTSVNWITVFRWHGTRLIKHRYPNTPRNFARFIALRDRIEETVAIPF